ncbi:Ribonuclease 4 [Vulpes lagopus]
MSSSESLLQRSQRPQRLCSPSRLPPGPGVGPRHAQLGPELEQPASPVFHLTRCLRNKNVSEIGISELVMAPPRTRALLLLLLLTLLGLGLVQPADGQDRMYQRFLRQHVDPEGKGGNDTYCNVMMQRRKMTTRQCKRFNTFVHEDIWNIRSICSTANIQCKNGKMNCHEGVVKVTDCRETGSSRAPNCRYRASASTRHVVIACEGDPELPVHFDR